MTAAKPSLELLRALSDEHVLTALMTERRLTRAELSERAGISKPTVAESIRRLVDAGVVADTGERTTGRGRIGSYYALTETAGTGLAVDISPDRIVADLVDAYGTVTAGAATPIRRPARPADVEDALREVLLRVRAQSSAAPRLAVVSAADPVDRRTGRLVHLPDAPFLLGDLDPVAVIGPHVDGPVLVDNDVNWAAHAERAVLAPDASHDFVYLFLGEGLGCAVVSDGEIRRGHHGFTGEIAHVQTAGTQGRSCPFIDVFAQLGVRHRDSTAIDQAALIAAVSGGTDAARRARSTLASAVTGVLAAIVALADPATIVLGGGWGTEPEIAGTIIATVASLRRPPVIQTARITTDAPLAGARSRAVSELRAAIVNYRASARAGVGTAP